jgi:glycosyltransferase involved in cell wall biosynthesis
VQGKVQVADSPVVSVVVPCFNHGRFLREALLSIGTPAVPTEIIVVDDGSADSTAEVVATFATPNLFRGVRQANEGLAAARNRGLGESRGRYVVFLDADDRLVPGAIDFGAACLEERPECAFVYGRCTMMDEDGTLLPTPEMPRVMRDHYREMLRRNYIWTPAAVMFRREPLERIRGFNADVNAAADYEIYLHLARHYPVYDHAEVVAHYRKHGGNMSGNAARMLRETLAVLRSQLPFLSGDDASLVAYNEGWRIWQEFYGAHLANEVREAVRTHRWFEAASKAAVLGYYHPRGFWHHARRKSELTLHALSRRDGSPGASPNLPLPADKPILGRADNGRG